MRVLLFGLSAVVASALFGAASPPLPRHGVLGATLTADATGAIVVRAVAPGSAAARAGIAMGDVVRRFADAPALSVAAIVERVKRTVPGTVVTLTADRAGTALTVPVTIAAPADETDPKVRTEYGALPIRGAAQRTLLDVPQGSGRKPAVLIVGGIGCFSVDVAANPEDGYLRIARDLARAGFVTMRLEKSDVGDSLGKPCRTVDFAEERASYTIALDALRADARVDSAHVYVLGHSIGTLIAPRLAAERPLAGVIVAEAVGRDWFEYELANLRRQLELGGDPPALVDEKLQSKARCMYRLLVAGDPESVIEAAEPACATRNGVYPVDAPYMRQVAALDVIGAWTHVNVPVLALYGTSDYVTAADDHQRIVDVVNAAHPGTATFARIDAMNHVLQVAATPADALRLSSDGTPGRYQQTFSTSIVRWLCAREHCT